MPLRCPSPEPHRFNCNTHTATGITAPQCARASVVPSAAARERPPSTTPRPRRRASAGGAVHMGTRRMRICMAAAHDTRPAARGACLYTGRTARTGKDRPKKARTAQKGKGRPIGLARRAASQAALLGWGLRGKPPYRRKWVWRTQLWSVFEFVVSTFKVCRDYSEKQILLHFGSRLFGRPTHVWPYPEFSSVNVGWSSYASGTSFIPHMLLCNYVSPFLLF